ncbi:MAG: polyprenyl synthetase family protein, partial [Dehalococcoidia bacterium]|nr:polyprenyl synthetase family protein [Dehalococcoidia bacterium]
MKGGRRNLSSVPASKEPVERFELDSVWNRYRPDIEAELRFVVGRASLPLYDMMRYHMGWIDESGRAAKNTAGKRLRPVLCLLTCHSLGGHWRSALPVAAAIELVHNFSLIHDDIQDSSIERRGRPTVWYMWGQPQAINVGDGMHALALSSLLRLEDIGIPNAKIVRAARILGEASLRLCEGQYLDISFERRMDIKISDYLTMISNKTAALVAGSVEIGAVLATENEPDIAHFKSFGHALGMTFQIHDDVLSIWGDEKKIGKSISTDIRSKKKTLPVVYLLEKARGAASAHLLEIYQ